LDIKAVAHSLNKLKHGTSPLHFSWKKV